LFEKEGVLEVFTAQIHRIMSMKKQFPIPFSDVSIQLPLLLNTIIVKL